MEISVAADGSGRRRPRAAARRLVKQIAKHVEQEQNSRHVQVGEVALKKKKVIWSYRDVRWRLNIDIAMVDGQVKKKSGGRWWFDGDICMVQRAGKALNKPFKGGVQQGYKVQNFTYHAITIAKIRFTLPSIIEFFTIEFDGDVNGAWTSRCSMVIDTSHISMILYERLRMSLNVIYLEVVQRYFVSREFRREKDDAQRDEQNAVNTRTHDE